MIIDVYFLTGITYYCRPLYVGFFNAERTLLILFNVQESVYERVHENRMQKC